MNPNFNTGQKGRKKVLIAPLDWGLGHTTRCIPLIKQLCQNGWEVTVAGTKTQEIIIKEEFPDLSFLFLPGYNIHYGSRHVNTLFSLLGQLPKIHRAIRNEKKWLKELLQRADYDLIISDNRFGCVHSSLPCIFITHQLQIQSPFGGGWTRKILERFNYRYIDQFAQCWVPDFPDGQNLAGALSHPARLPKTPVRYIGPLSRFTGPSPGIREEKNRLLILLSGPEPQRSFLEEIMVKQITHHTGPVTIVRGLPGENPSLSLPDPIRAFQHLSAQSLKEEIQKAEFVICRSGYSSVMDLAFFQKKAILIPTPGQTEQEFLGAYLEEKGLAVLCYQDKFALTAVLERARGFDYKSFPANKDDLLSSAIEEIRYR